MSAAVRVEREGGLAIVTVDHPPLNLWDSALDAALRAAIDELEREPPRGVLFRAEGRVVSGGVDVAEFATLQTAADAGGAVCRPDRYRPSRRHTALPDRVRRSWACA